MNSFHFFVQHLELDLTSQLPYRRFLNLADALACDAEGSRDFLKSVRALVRNGKRTVPGYAEPACTAIRVREMIPAIQLSAVRLPRSRCAAGHGRKPDAITDNAEGLATSSWGARRSRIT